MSLLDKVYDPEEFRKNGHMLVDLLADNLQNNLNQKNDKVINYIRPDTNYERWNQLEFENPAAFFKEVINNSIQLQHPRYIGHQVSAPAPLAALAGFEGMMLNSGGAIYEMSAASSTLERVVIDKLKGYFGLDDGDGIITSGGTLANLTALICARNIKASEDIWNEGQKEKYAFMVSEEAHYCIDRAVRVMGWGDEGIIKIPVDDQYRMRAELLASYHAEAQSRGITVLGVVGSAPTTSTGIYDDLESIGAYCITNNLWFHIDAAHGGPAVFSEKYKYLMSGCHLADSITVDAHKMMMTPSLTTMLFFKNSKDSYRTFAQKAQYLWSASDEEWYNYGKRTMECTKIMLSTRVYALMSIYGMKIFETYLDRCYDMGRKFAEIIHSDSKFELAVTPQSNIVCFRVKGENTDETNALNRNIRHHLLEDGSFYIVQTVLKDKVYLRVSIMNPFTETTDLEALLNRIKDLL
ncbi:MAG: pyridoxal-dependent decarboxylase [Saprospiraceae bacterium]|nr:pyridoxal-dependent decarboxylase [Saprospiraceae bacterium]